MPDLVQRPDGKWAEQAPKSCPECGHGWPVGTAGRMLVGTHICNCGPHRTYECLACGYRTYRPELAAGCTVAPPRMMAPNGNLTEEW